MHTPSHAPIRYCPRSLEDEPTAQPSAAAAPSAFALLRSAERRESALAIGRLKLPESMADEDA